LKASIPPAIAYPSQVRKKKNKINLFLKSRGNIF